MKECPFRWAGQYFDSETNLYYNRFRLAGNNPTLYTYVHDPNTWLDSFGLDCKKATKKGHAYEKRIRNMYGDTPFKRRQYKATVNGKRVSGVADNVTVINGKNVAIEAKYVEDWSKSIRNPNSKIGDKGFAIAEQEKMLSQAQKYSDAFDEVIYHTNSPELANHYTKIFQDAGLNNVTIKVTP